MEALMVGMTSGAILALIVTCSTIFTMRRYFMTGADWAYFMTVQPDLQKHDKDIEGNPLASWILTSQWWLVHHPGFAEDRRLKQLLSDWRKVK